MITLVGKYNRAKVFADVFDSESVKQVVGILNLESIKGTKVRMMPDIHAGKGCTVGTTIHLHDKVIPNLVGVDIGCGMKLIQIKEKEADLQKLDEVIKEYIPSGFSIRQEALPESESIPYDELYCPIDKENAMKSIGTLGGGNHFVELDRDDEDNLYLVIHSGSRHMGLEVCGYYQNLAYHECNHSSKEDIQNLIKTLKEQGRHKEIEKELHKLKDTKRTNIPKDLCHLEGDSFHKYIHDMKITQEYASLNRKMMAKIIVEKMGWTAVDSFSTIHNYIDTDNMILRKGAVSAQDGERLLIPINMRDGSLICVGKGNPDWNFSAPHGAGRIMSRSQAKQQVAMEDFRETMAGIYSSSVCEETLDESPFAYKDMKDIMNNIGDTVVIKKQIKPVYNYKAH